MLGLPFDDSKSFKIFEFFFFKIFKKKRNFHVQDEKFPFPVFSEAAFISDRIYSNTITWLDENV